jgi:glycosyl transferase, family 25
MIVETSIVVISLPNATARRAKFSARAEQAPICWSFFDAHTELRPGLTYDPDDAIVAIARELHPAELGCYSSHYSAWLKLLESDGRQMIVLEDDTIVDWAFIAKLAAVDLRASGVSYLRLYAKRPCRWRRIGAHAVEPRRYLAEFLDYTWGTQAYAITRDAAERFVRHCRRVRRPIDNELDRSWDHGIPNLCIFPFPVIEESTASTIGRGLITRLYVPERLHKRRRRSKLLDRALKFRQRLWQRFDSSTPGRGLLVKP